MSSGEVGELEKKKQRCPGLEGFGECEWVLHMLCFGEETTCLAQSNFLLREADAFTNPRL